MKISLEFQPAERVDAEALIVPVFEGRPETRFGAASLAGEVTGKALEMTLLHHVSGMAAARVLLAGAGQAAKFTASEQRNLAGAALRCLKSKSVTRVALALDPAFAAPEFAQAAVEGAILGDFDADTYKTGEKKKAVESFTVAAAARDESLEPAVERGRIVAEAQNSARALVNEPANQLTPPGVAAAARQVAAEFGLECQVLGREEMAALGMRALLGVAQGSAQPPALAMLRYQPPGAFPKVHLALIGKGVTFDSGGISIKPSDGMEKMKYDMAGGASAIGAMRAIAQLKPAIAVTAFIPCVENMPGGRAQRPGDIVAAMSGKTIEVINTDAEGRLILADALTYARSRGCTHLVDVATLTGAIVVALGHLRAGLFSSDDGLRDRVLSAALSAGERMWPMPLDEDYKDYLKSAFADLANVGGRWGGAVTAAIFLKEFAADTPWVHLDIAGTAWLDEEKPHLAKGPTGLPVRTLVRLALDWEE
jgi:leucyl aminopeptidase